MMRMPLALSGVKALIHAAKRCMLLPVYWLTKRGARRSLATALAAWLEDMGPAYVKIGQILATRVGDVPDWLSDPLSRLQDRVRPIGGRQLHRALTAGLGAPIADCFRVFDLNAIAAGSVAQVHRAELWDGRTVAVKVVRPNGRQEAAVALSMFRFLAVHLQSWPSLRGVPLLAAFEQVSRAIDRQFDMRIEAEMNTRLQAIFAGDSEVTIPFVVAEFSSTNVLVMEFCTDLPRLEGREHAASTILAVRAGLRALYRMILTDGLIHCDMHGCNVYFLGTGKVVILDTGFMEVFSSRELFLFREFFIGVLLGDGCRCARILIESASWVSTDADLVGFEREIVRLVSSRSRVSARQFGVASFGLDLFRIQRNFRVRGSERFALAIYALLVFEGTVVRVEPDLDFQAEAACVLGPYLMRRGFYGG